MTRLEVEWVGDRWEVSLLEVDPAGLLHPKVESVQVEKDDLTDLGRQVALLSHGHTIRSHRDRKVSK